MRVVGWAGVNRRFLWMPTFLVLWFDRFLLSVYSQANSSLRSLRHSNLSCSLRGCTFSLGLGHCCSLHIWLCCCYDAWGSQVWLHLSFTNLAWQKPKLQAPQLQFTRQEGLVNSTDSKYIICIISPEHASQKPRVIHLCSEDKSCKLS